MTGKAEAKTSPRRVKGRERQIKALELRKAGATYAQIAQQLGYSEAGALRAVTASLTRMALEPTEAVRKLELARLDQMWMLALQRAKEGNLQALTVMCQIMDRRARYLGLDAPTKISFDLVGECRRIAEEFGVPVAEVLAEYKQRLLGETAGGNGKIIEVEKIETPV